MDMSAAQVLPGFRRCGLALQGQAAHGIEHLASVAQHVVAACPVVVLQQGLGLEPEHVREAREQPSLRPAAREFHAPRRLALFGHRQGPFVRYHVAKEREDLRTGQVGRADLVLAPGRADPGRLAPGPSASARVESRGNIQTPIFHSQIKIRKGNNTPCRTDWELPQEAAGTNPPRNGFPMTAAALPGCAAGA